MDQAVLTDLLLSLKNAHELTAEVLQKMRFSHRHKEQMGGCEECLHINKLSQVLSSLSQATLTNR